MTCDDVRDKELVAQYVHRRLSEAERDQFEEHFIGCASCFNEVQDFRVLRQELAHAVPVAAPVIASSPAWWRAFVPVLALGAAAALVIALYYPRTSDSQPGSAQIATSGSPAQPATGKPAVPAGPSRIELVGQLARFEPPAYLPANLRGAEDDADRRFKAAMARYTAKDFEAAASELRAVRAIKPDSADALFYLGVCDLEGGRARDAITSFEKVIALGDMIYEEDARFFLAKAWLAVDDTTRAKAELTRVVALGGDRAKDARTLAAAIETLPSP